MFTNFIILILMIITTPSIVFSGDIDNRLILEKLNSLSRRVDDRFSVMDDKFASLEKQIDLLRDDMNRRFEAVDKRFDDQQMLNYFVFGSILTVLTLVSALIVLIIWDRRSFLYQVYEEIDKLKS